MYLAEVRLASESVKNQLERTRKKVMVVTTSNKQTPVKPHLITTMVAMLVHAMHHGDIPRQDITIEVGE